MKNLLTLLACLVVFISCNSLKKTKNSSAADTPIVDTTSYSATDKVTVSEVADEGERETLNDIRFDGWTKKEWADNEYIRAVRRYIDDYNSGKIKDEYLDEYKEFIQGKFVIGDIKPGLWGGAFIYIMFYNNPDKIFTTLVYSDVDEETRVVSNYECRGLKYEDMDLGYTQNDIDQFLIECPHHKMW